MYGALVPSFSVSYACVVSVKSFAVPALILSMNLG